MQAYRIIYHLNSATECVKMHLIYGTIKTVYLYFNRSNTQVILKEGKIKYIYGLRVASNQHICN